MAPVNVSDKTDIVLVLEIFSYNSKCFKIRILNANEGKRNEVTLSNEKLENRSKYDRLCPCIFFLGLPA